MILITSLIKEIYREGGFSSHAALQGLDIALEICLFRLKRISFRLSELKEDTKLYQFFVSSLAYTLCASKWSQFLSNGEPTDSNIVTISSILHELYQDIHLTNLQSNLGDNYWWHESIQYVGFRHGNIKESKILKNELWMELSWSFYSYYGMCNPPEMEKLNWKHPIIWLFNISLIQSNPEGEKNHLKLDVQWVNMVKKLKSLNVTLVISQKRIPQHLQYMFLQQNIGTIERISIRYIDLIAKLSGAHIVSEWKTYTTWDENMLGQSIQSLSLKKKENREFFHWIGNTTLTSSKNRSYPLYTIHLHTFKTENLKEIHYIFKRYLKVLFQSEGIVPGAGYLESLWITELLQYAEQFSKNSCTRGIGYIMKIMAKSLRVLLSALDNKKDIHSVLSSKNAYRSNITQNTPPNTWYGWNPLISTFQEFSIDQPNPWIVQSTQVIEQGLRKAIETTKIFVQVDKIYASA